MYNPNANNILLTIRSQLDGCSYNQNMKDYLANLIMSVVNYPKATTPARHYVRNMGQDKIIMIWYPMSVPFVGRNYNVPIQIYIMKNIPYEPPQIFLEVPNGSGINTKNPDINPNSRRILTYTLRNWSQYSIIGNAMNEIFDSFSRIFPIYKKSSNQPSQPPQASGGGGIYNLMKNEANNLYQQYSNPNNNNNQGSSGNIYGYKPPAQNIYGKPMSNNNNNNQQPTSFGGGIYANNNNNNNNNNQQPTSFGGGIYANNNNNNNNNNYNNNNYNNNNIWIRFQTFPIS